MITTRPSSDRGHINHGWLDTYHTFSFGDYHDPRHVRFRALRVINEDVVAPGAGFGMHPHRDMEIITVVLSGALAHRDSMGHESVIRPGEVQFMSAGSGIEHSEYNASRSEPVHLLQIWIMPAVKSTEPRYDQKRFDASLMHNQLLPLVTSDGRDNSITIGQDASLLRANLDAGIPIQYEMHPGRHAWVQVISGRVTVNNRELVAGDGAAISDEQALSIRADEAADVLVFDLS